MLLEVNATRKRIYPTTSMTKYFGEHKIEFIEKDNELWLTAKQVGECLDYEDPRKAVHNLISRNQDEFEGLTSALELRTEAGTRETTTLSRDAINLVCMLSKQAKAKLFRKWVLKIVREVQTHPYPHHRDRHNRPKKHSNSFQVSLFILAC